ncbi:unnamed protein product [Phytomonas sp. Hart1]|nr:unnamed protein product [Phytomonas sp. Hart1]|eukprot:CCW68496.1 unnamed protein product [Phytomonas sp. isolate Hart1]
MVNKPKTEDEKALKKTPNAELVPRTSESRLKYPGHPSNNHVERYTRVDATTKARQMYQHDPQSNSHLYCYSYDSRDDPTFNNQYNEKDGKGCVVQRKAAFYTSSTPHHRSHRSNHEARVEEILPNGNAGSPNAIARQPIVEEPGEAPRARREVARRNPEPPIFQAGRNDPFESMSRCMEAHMAQIESTFGNFGMGHRGRSMLDDVFPMTNDWPFDQEFFGGRGHSKYQSQSGL